MLCVDRLASVNIVATLGVTVSGTDSRTGRDVNFSGQYTHNPPSRGVNGITYPHQRARAGNCPTYIPGAYVMLGVRTLGDVRNQFQPFKISDWIPNTSPVLSANGNGGTVPNGGYVTATQDATLPDPIDGIGPQVIAGESYIVRNGQWEPAIYGMTPTAAQTFAWEYNTAPVIASGGLVDGVRAAWGDSYVCDRTTTVSPPIDGIYDLAAGEIIQFTGFGWQRLSEVIPFSYQRSPFWTTWCRNMWDVTAYLPNIGGVTDPDSGPIWLNGSPNSDMFLGYAPPASWANPMSAWLRRFLDREHPEIQFTLWDNDWQVNYNGKVFADSTSEWNGNYTDPDTGITVDASYKFTITRV
jgi:hypothetical protein